MRHALSLRQVFDGGDDLPHPSPSVAQPIKISVMALRTHVLIF